MRQNEIVNGAATHFILYILNVVFAWIADILYRFHYFFSLPITWFYLYIVLFVIWDYWNIRAHGSSTFICSILWAIVNTGKKCSAIVLIKIKWMAHKNHEKRFYWLASCQSFNSIEIQVFGKLTTQDSIRRRKKIFTIIPFRVFNSMVLSMLFVSSNMWMSASDCVFVNIW